MLAPSPAQRVGLADAPDPALEVVDVEAEVVDVPLGVGGVLAGDQQDPAAVAAYGREGLVGAGERERRRDRVVGVERAEPVTGGADGVGGQVVASRWSSGGPRFAISSATGKSTPSSPPSAVRVALKPGTVSISVMSRSKPTTSWSMCAA